MTLKAVLFDLDDTLYDHQWNARSGLTALRDAYPCFQQKPFAQLEMDHQTWLDALHGPVLRGEKTLEVARLERFHQLLLQYGDTPQADTAHQATQMYRTGYLAAERCIPGAVALIEKLRAHGIRIGVVTNSTADEQHPKIARMGIGAMIDVLVISGEAGAVKPDPRIFAIALDQLGVRPDEAVMVGDNWSADVAGARAAGIRAVWISRYGQPCPDPSLATEINALEPLDEVFNILMNGH